MNRNDKSKQPSFFGRTLYRPPKRFLSVGFGSKLFNNDEFFSRKPSSGEDMEQPKLTSFTSVDKHKVDEPQPKRNGKPERVSFLDSLFQHTKTPQVYKGSYSRLEKIVVSKVCSFKNSDETTSSSLTRLENLYLQGKLDTRKTKLPRSIIKKQLGFTRKGWESFSFLASRDEGKLFLADVVGILWLLVQDTDDVAVLVFSLFALDEELSINALNSMLRYILSCNLGEERFFETFFTFIPSAAQKFFNFMQSNRTEELIMFYSVVNKLQEKVPVNEAKDIYNSFVRENSQKEINVFGEIRKDLERDIFFSKPDKEGNLNSSIFDSIKSEVISLIHSGPYPRFVQKLGFDKNCSLFNNSMEWEQFDQWFDNLDEGRDLFDFLITLRTEAETAIIDYDQSEIKNKIRKSRNRILKYGYYLNTLCSYAFDVKSLLNDLNKNLSFHVASHLNF
eukprot:snap_masked-scaffold_45-processed-gene-1.71-mRNA-1 protein AED:0.17 eAED:1.00 QI:0/0/0/1/1/1/3/0/447